MRLFYSGVRVLSKFILLEMVKIYEGILFPIELILITETNVLNL